MVFRVWGTDAATGDVLSTENVSDGYVTFPGMANQKLNWGAHGATTNRVWFWTAAVNLPADYPLGAGRPAWCSRRTRARPGPTTTSSRSCRPSRPPRRPRQGQAREQGREPLRPAGGVAMRPTRSRSFRRVVAASGALVLAVALAVRRDGRRPRPVTPPQMPGAAPLFGPLADAGVAAETVSTLKTTPDVAVPGKPVTITGAGLPKSKDVKLVWMTANVRWIIDPKATASTTSAARSTRSASRWRTRRPMRRGRSRRPSASRGTSAGCTTSSPSSTGSRLPRAASCSSGR